MSSEFDKRLNKGQEAQTGLAYEDIIKEAYLGLLGRTADTPGFVFYLDALRKGTRLCEVIKSITDSEEFQCRRTSPLLGSIVLPDLTKLYPDKYVRKGSDSAILKASSEEDFSLMETLIAKYRYYDSFRVWAPRIDLDKHVTAAIVRGLGAQTCLELGCFTGSVLSVLADQGIDVCGIEVSHLAFLLAHGNIHEKLRFGNLLELPFDTAYDVFLGMDILEHLNPLHLDHYIARIAQLIKPEGFIPMFGRDDVFGTVFEAYLPEWQQAGEDDFWRYMHCDAKGWPMHGHLVWASPRWWENSFLKQGLVRDRNIEGILHSLLGSFFEKIAPARRSFFVLRHSDSHPNTENMRRNLGSTISSVWPA